LITLINNAHPRGSPFRENRNSRERNSVRAEQCVIQKDQIFLIIEIYPTARAVVPGQAWVCVGCGSAAFR